MSRGGPERKATRVSLFDPTLGREAEVQPSTKIRLAALVFPTAQEQDVPSVLTCFV